jgi:hypothetical protein
MSDIYAHRQLRAPVLGRSSVIVFVQKVLAGEMKAAVRKWLKSTRRWQGRGKPE